MPIWKAIQKCAFRWQVNIVVIDKSGFNKLKPSIVLSTIIVYDFFWCGKTEFIAVNKNGV
jgi:hypothetical protein